MKLFKEIKRRAHNVALAIIGRGPEWQEKLEPVKITINPGRIETFCVEQIMPSDLARCSYKTKIEDWHYKNVARRIGDGLLQNGCIKFEVFNQPYHDVSVLRGRVQVVRPEKEGAV